MLCFYLKYFEWSIMDKFWKFISCACIYFLITVFPFIFRKHEMTVVVCKVEKYTRNAFFWHYWKYLKSSMQNSQPNCDWFKWDRLKWDLVTEERGPIVTSFLGPKIFGPKRDAGGLSNHLQSQVHLKVKCGTKVSQKQKLIKEKGI